MKNKKEQEKLNEEGEAGLGSDAPVNSMGIDILAGGSGYQPDLGVLGVGNFSFPRRLGEIKKRLFGNYHLKNKK